MAKQSIVAVIRAKPNARGKTSHLPMECSVKKCTNEALIHKGPFANRKRICASHWENPPQDTRKNKQVAKLRSMGLV